MHRRRRDIHKADQRATCTQKLLTETCSASKHTISPKATLLAQTLSIDMFFSGNLYDRLLLSHLLFDIMMALNFPKSRFPKSSDPISLFRKSMVWSSNNCFDAGTADLIRVSECEPLLVTCIN
jgi:hypothetical protein